LADVGERSVSVVVIENIFAEIRDEEIFVAVVIVIADADALAPSGVADSGLRGDIRKRSVAIVFEKMRGRRLPRRKTFEARAVHQKNIEPAIVVVVVESDAAARRFEQIFVFMFAAKDRFDVEASLLRYVDEADAEVARLCRRRGAADWGL